METVTFSKTEYFELLEIKKKLEKILEEKKKASLPKGESFLKAFGILKDSFKGDSLDYVSRARKEWR